METQKLKYSALILGALILLMSACVTYRSAGVYVAPGPKGKPVTLAELQKRWTDYNVYYSGLAEDVPAAVLFDPRNDDLKVSGRRWTRVESKNQLDSMLDFIEGYLQSYPRLYSLTKGDKIFGYVFSPVYDIQTKLVNEKTLYVFEIVSPLYRDGGRDTRGSIVH